MARVTIGQAYRTSGDDTAATSELRAAKSALDKLEKFVSAELGDEDDDARERMDRLKHTLARALPGKVHVYETTWTGGADAPIDADAATRAVIESLAQGLRHEQEAAPATCAISPATSLHRLCSSTAA